MFIDSMTYMTLMKEKRMLRRRSELWTVAEAKAHFSAMMERARSQGPQTITRHGKTAAVVVSAEEWTRSLQRKGNLAEFLSKSPLAGSGLKIERSSSLPRKNGL